MIIISKHLLLLCLYIICIIILGIYYDCVYIYIKQYIIFIKETIIYQYFNMIVFIYMEQYIFSIKENIMYQDSNEMLSWVCENIILAKSHPVKIHFNILIFISF